MLRDEGRQRPHELAPAGGHALRFFECLFVEVGRAGTLPPAALSTPPTLGPVLLGVLGREVDARGGVVAARKHTPSPPGVWRRFGGQDVVALRERAARPLVEHVVLLEADVLAASGGRVLGLLLDGLDQRGPGLALGVGAEEARAARLGLEGAVAELLLDEGAELLPGRLGLGDGRAVVEDLRETQAHGLAEEFVVGLGLRVVAVEHVAPRASEVERAHMRRKKQRGNAYRRVLKTKKKQKCTRIED